MKEFPLSEVVEINPRYQGNGTMAPSALVSFVPMASVGEDGCLNVREMRPISEVKKGFTYFENGDVLLAKITPCFENGKATMVKDLANTIGFGSTEFHVLRPSKQIDQRYLFYAVWNQNFRKIGADRMTGSAGQKRVPTDFLRNYRIPLPDLSEQRRIATILDKADAIRRKRRQAIKTIEDFLQSSFVSLVGEGHPDYPNWTEYTIESLAAKEKGSLRTGPFGSALRHSEFVDSGIAVLGIDNAVNNVFRWDERRFITPQKYEGMKRYTVKPNDVIITIMGTTGRSAVVPNDIPLAISTKHLATITCNRDLIEPEFLSNAFHRDEAVLKQLRGANRGAIMDGLNLGIIKSTKLKVPPLSQQNKFNCVLEGVRKIQTSLDVSDASICELVGALSARYFSGAKE